MFSDGQRADEEVFLLDVGGQAGHAAADAAAVDSHLAGHRQRAAVAICQHVQQRRLARTAAQTRGSQFTVKSAYNNTDQRLIPEPQFGLGTWLHGHQTDVIKLSKKSSPIGYLHADATALFKAYLVAPHLSSSTS